MPGQDEVMRRIAEAIERSQRGDREGARQRFAGLWKELSPDEDYRKVGDLTRAREHVARARASVEALGDDGYARMIRAGIERLARQL